MKRYLWLIQMLVPWPRKKTRKAAIEAARKEKEVSIEGRSRAKKLEAELLAMRQTNHFAASIAAQIRRRR